MPRKSTGNYAPNWKQIADDVKTDAGWQCIRCGHPHDPASGYTLTVHHLTLDPSNNAWWNLTALCQRCHLQIQNKVVMERQWYLPYSDWFRPYVAGFYANMLGMPDDRPTVMSMVDELIAMGAKPTNGGATMNGNITHRNPHPDDDELVLDDAPMTLSIPDSVFIRDDPGLGVRGPVVVTTENENVVFWAGGTAVEIVLTVRELPRAIMRLFDPAMAVR